MSSQQQQPHQRVFLVTGANKGIGFEVVKKLSANHPTDLILLGSRDQKRGEDALTQLGSPLNVKVLVLDTSSKESIEQAKQEIQQRYGGYLDIIINNAGIASYESGLKPLKDIFNTNFYGVKQMNDSMAQLLRDDGRIINVSSGLGATSLKHCSQDLKTKFLNPDLTETQLEQLFAP
jgi:NAD(P)-dependent dehydrogenase (short-subunit alcohol dehydrogenase family)